MNKDPERLRREHCEGLIGCFQFKQVLSSTPTNEILGFG